MLDDYSIWFLEYAYIKEFPAGLTMMGDFDGQKTKLNHGYAYIEGNGHKMLVDTGYGYWGESKIAADSWGLKNFKEPKEVLGQIGVSPEEIDTVFLTHAHLDHAGNVGAFPNATFYLQKRELEESVKMINLPKQYSGITSAVLKQDIMALLELLVEGRLILVEGTAENVVPGIDLYPAFDTHSLGHQYVRIRNEKQDKSWVFCGDLVFNYQNLTGRNGDGVYVPIVNGGGLFMNLLKVYDHIMSLVDGDVLQVVPMHEPAVADKFPSKMWSEELYNTEIYLAEGVKSRI